MFIVRQNAILKSRKTLLNKWRKKQQQRQQHTRRSIDRWIGWNVYKCFKSFANYNVFGTHSHRCLFCIEMKKATKSLYTVYYFSICKFLCLCDNTIWLFTHWKWFFTKHLLWHYRNRHQSFFFISVFIGIKKKNHNHHQYFDIFWLFPE